MLNQLRFLKLRFNTSHSDRTWYAMLKVLNALNLIAAFLVLMGIGLVAMAEFEALDKKVRERACVVDFIGCDAPELRPAQ